MAPGDEVLQLSNLSCGLIYFLRVSKTSASSPLDASGEALRKSASIAAIQILAMKTQQASELLSKVPPFAPTA